VNVPEEGVSWREILWLCLTFHGCTSLSSPLPLSLSPSLPLPLSLHSSLNVARSEADCDQRPARIRGQRARAQVNPTESKGGGAEVEGGLTIPCGRDLRWANGQAASAPCKPFPARICSLERSVAGDSRRPAQGTAHFICSLSFAARPACPAPAPVPACVRGTVRWSSCRRPPHPRLPQLHRLRCHRAKSSRLDR